jgi:hypothetical protein
LRVSDFQATLFLAAVQGRSMQKEAIAVVDAARGLGARLMPGTRHGFELACPKSRLPEAFVTLALAIERFDRAGADAADPVPALLLKCLSRSFDRLREAGLDGDAVSDIEAFLAASGADDLLRTLVEPLVLRPQPGAYGAMDPEDIEKLVHEIRSASLASDPDAPMAKFEMELGDLGRQAAEIKARLGATLEGDHEKKAEMEARLDAVVVALQPPEPAPVPAAPKPRYA